MQRTGISVLVRWVESEVLYRAANEYQARAAADSEAYDLKQTASALTLLLQSWRQSGESTTSLSWSMYVPAWWRR
jgi:hypothetical protein